MPIRCTDLTILNSLFKGDATRVAEWIELYLEEAPDYFKRLEAGAATGDAKALAFAAHELRPQAHYLGAPELLELLVLIGEKAGSEGVEACSPAVKEVLEMAMMIEMELKESKG